jgi:EAL domain-containing protein (putative c-di-GMP-specific phosphodiesterase class I)
VVEGIETNEQLELISADGTVSEAQGYLFSKPVPAARVRQLLDASHGRHGGETPQAAALRPVAATS